MLSMKNTKAGMAVLTVLAAGLFAFSLFQDGSIKGKVTPSDAAIQVWALSASDTLKAPVNNGNFEIPAVKPGTYKMYADAKDPYKDVVKDDVQVSDGAPVDLGEIKPEK